MNHFQEALQHMNQTIYEPKQLTVESIQEEKQNAEYGAGMFRLSSKLIRFRVAKITPTKIGQFVAFWEKGSNNKNRPFLSTESPELLVVTTFKNNNEFGQFVFPKEILVEKNILRSPSTTGKMAIRVYPSWDKPTSKQALKTQKWQLPYFVDMSTLDQTSLDKLMERYSL